MREEFRIGIVGAEHQQQIAMHDRVVDGLRADHADAAHPARVVVRHDVLALDRMDQRRLEPIGERAQFVGCAMAPGAAHDHDAAGLIDPAGDIGDVCITRCDFGSWLQRREAGHAAVGLCRDDILRQRQMRDATAGIGGCDRLMNDGRCLSRRGDRFGVQRDITEQEIGFGRLDEVGAVQLARHVPGERKNRRMVAARLIEAGDEMGAAGSGRSGADPKPTSKLGLASGCERRSLLMADADPFNFAVADRIGERIERVADQCENMLDANLLEHANQDVRDCLGHRYLLKNRGLSSRTKSISDASNDNPSTVGSNQGLIVKSSSALQIILTMTFFPSSRVRARREEAFRLARR